MFVVNRIIFQFYVILVRTDCIQVKSFLALKQFVRQSTV